MVLKSDDRSRKTGPDRLADRLGDQGKRKDFAAELQRELEREFLFEQLERLTADFADDPAQIGGYLADLEIAGLLSPADKGMIFRRLWETMGPAFADQAFGMTARALDSGDMLAAEIAEDAFAEVRGDQAIFSDAAEYERALEATRALEALSRALGLKIDVPRPELKRRPDDRILDVDPERAEKTREILGSLGSQLGVDTGRLDVRVDAEAHDKTAGQGIWGLMTDGTVFLDPEIYDPETSEGRHLLAHEVVHVAQLENRLRGANDAPDLFQAEAEADELSAYFAETGDVARAPLASLAAYDQAACGPREMTTPTPQEPTRTVEVIPDIYEPVEDCFPVDPILFKVDKFKISETTNTAPTAVEILQKVARSIKAYPEITKMKIEGHTSTTATWDHNMELSNNRAHSVRDWLAGEGGVTIGLDAEGFGEKVAREETGITDDSRSVEVQAHRKVIYRIVEVDGKAVPPGWKPTRQVLVTPGRTITRYYDAEGNLIKEEIVVNGAAGAEVAEGTGGGAQTGTNPNQSAPVGQANTTTGGTAPTQEPVHEVESTLPGSEQVGPEVPPPPPQQAGKNELNIRQKVKFPKRKKKAAAPRQYAKNTLGLGWMAQAKAGPGGLTSTQIAERSRSAGGGEPIPDGVRSRFEQAFGASFSDVRIHRGSAQATGIGATAFARGTDIHFAPGRFDPDSSSGLATLGHELTHIVQQRAGRVAVPQGKGTHVNVERHLEAEADLLGARAARGESVHVQGSSAGLYSRAARGEADTIQYEGGAGETGGGARPTKAKVRLAGVDIEANMPSSPANPGRITVDFNKTFGPLELRQASLVFNDQWEITEGHITAAVNIGSYVQCDDLRLEVTQKTGGDGNKYAELAAVVDNAQFKVEGLLESTINLRLATTGVSGSATVNFNQLTLGQGIALTSGTLDFTLPNEGPATVGGTVNGTIAVGEVNLNVELRGRAMSDGNFSAGATVSLANPVPVPGVEGVTITSGSITGDYVHKQQWSVTGNLGVNVRDWVQADISATYTQPASGGEGGDQPAQWELNGILRQLQPYSVGEGENALAFTNGELDFHFKNGEFLKVAAKADYETTNWKGNISGTFDVPQTKLTAKGTITLKPPELPIGTTGIKFTKVEAQVDVKDNELEKIQGGFTVVFPYQEQDTFELKGTDVFYVVKDSKVTGTATVTTLRQLDFGDPAGYSASVKQGAVGELSVADNKLLGISGGLSFEVKHAGAKLGDGTVDINFDGPTQKLNATAKFTLTTENGFGVPDRVTGPVMLLPGGQFTLTIENSALGSASVRGVKFEVKQAGEGATGKIAGEVNGDYSFKNSKLTATGNAQIKGDWPLSPVDGVTLTFKEGGNIDIAITDSKLTRVNGDFPYKCDIGARGQIPEIKLEGNLNGDYSDENKKFSGALTGELKNNVDIPVNEDKITIKSGSTFKATVANSAPADFTVAFDVDYYRKGELFLQGHVEKANYDFKNGHFGFKGDLTLKAKIEKQTEDGKWKFVVQPGSKVGVEVEESKLKLITGQIDFEVHDATGALLTGHLTEAEVDVQKLEFSGKLDVHLARDLAYPRSPTGGEEAPKGEPPVQAVAKKDVSHVWGVVTRNALSEIGAKLVFGVNLGGVEYGAGELSGTLDMKQFQFDGTGKINLVRDLVLGGDETNAEGDKIATWHLCFPAGQGLDMKVTKNQLDEANIKLSGQLLHNSEVVATGAVNGRYKLGETKGFNGEINANVIKDVDLTQDERFKYWLEIGSSFKTVITANAIASANGAFKVRLDEIPNGNKQAVRVGFSGDYTKGVGFKAEGKIEVLNDLKVGEGEEFKFFIAQGSSGGASISGFKVTRLHGNLDLNVDKGDAKFAKGQFNLDYNHTDTNAKLNCDGKVELLARTDVSGEGESDWKFFLCPATGIAFKVTNSDLDWVKGQINFASEFKGGEVITGNVNVEYFHKPHPEVFAKGQIQVTNEIPVGELKGYKFIVEPSTGASFDVKHSDLYELSAGIKVRIEDKSPLARVELQGTFKNKPEQRFDGTGTIELIRDVEVGASDDGKYKFNVLKGTGASAKLNNSKLEEIKGTLSANICDESEFAKFDGTITATKAEDRWRITAENVSLKVNRDKEFDVAGEWKVTLLDTSGGDLTVRNNKLERVGGTILVKVDKGEKLSAKITLGGEYTPGNGFTGQGKAELLTDYEVGQKAPYGFHLVKGGTEAVIDIAKSALTHVGGKVNFKVTEDSKDFVTGNASVDYDVTKGILTEAKGSGQLANDKTLGTYAGFTLVAVKGSNADFLAQNGSLIRIGGELNLRVDESGKELARGSVKADFDVKGSKFTGSGEVTLTRDYGVSAQGLNGHGQPESWGLAFKAQSKLSLSIKENVFETAHIDIAAVGYHNTQACADGRIVADYKVGDPNGVTGKLNLNVTRRVPLLEGSGRFDYHVDTGTSFEGQAEKGSVKSFKGLVKLVATEASKDKVTVDVNATYTAGKGVDGSGQIKVVSPILIKEGGEWKLWLDEGSGGNGSIKNSGLEEVGGQVKIRVDKKGTPFATGDFTASYKVSEGTNAQTTAKGTVQLIGKVDVTPSRGGEFKVFLTAGTGIEASVKNGDLEYIDGKINGELHWKSAPLARFDLQAKYDATGEGDFSGDGKLETIAPVKIIAFAGYTLYLGVGANITGSVKHFALHELTANIPLELHKPAGVCVVQASLEGKYKHAEKDFEGTGKAEVLKQITIAEGVGSKGYSFYLEPSSGVTVDVKANSLKEVTGTLVVLVSDAPGPAAGFLKATAKATYRGGDQPTVDVDGKLEVIRSKEMLSTKAGYVVWLAKGSEATVNVTANELTRIGGKANVDVKKGGTDFVKIGLQGEYTPDAGFSGKGTAELCTEWEIASTKIGEDTYTVWVTKGTGAEITLASSDIKHVGGSVNAMIRDAPSEAGNFIKIEAKADYDFPGKNFSGSGSITVLKPKKLATFSGEQLWLAEGSGASGSVSNNNLQKVSGNLNLQLKDEKIGHWLSCTLEGGFDAAGGTGFSGKGSVTVHKDKQLAELAGYKFVLAEGAGAKAVIAENKLTEVNGQVPFKVYDNKSEPLITGKAEGHYYSTSKKFSGSGEVYLGRDIEFEIGGGKLVFKKGSGGGGKVTDNELRELTGTLKVDIHDSKGPMVGLEASGKFNAVTKTLERVEGSAKLLRPIEVGGEGDNAFLRITQLSGSALVENNELKKIEGSLDLVLPKLNNMKGHFEGGWQKTQSEDLFWGKGWIDFTLFKDEAKGRSVSGKIDGEYFKNGDFKVKGEVQYKLNHMIGGTIGVEVDQNLDPILSGTLEITDVTLVQGRDLFKWSKDFTLIKQTVMAGPVPIAIQGGVFIGLGLGMLPLTFSASVGISNFRPLSSKSQVPDFFAKAQLDTGLRFNAKLCPWFSVGVGVGGVASAGIALQGEAGLGVDVKVTPYATLKGQGGVYSGALGLGLKVIGSGNLALTPKLYAELLSKKWDYDLPGLNHPLGELFSFGYNFEFPFGDQPAAPTEGGAGAAPPTDAPAKSTKSEGRETAPPADPTVSGAPNRPGAVPGGPDLNQGNNDSKEAGAKDDPMADLMSKLDEVTSYGEKIGNIAAVGGEMVSALMFVATLGLPAGLVVAVGQIAYKFAIGELTFAKIEQAGRDLWSFIQMIDLSMLTRLLPDWLVSLWNYIKDKSLDDLLCEMIDWIADTLNDWFPSASPVVDVIREEGKNVVRAMGSIVRAVISGSIPSLDDFLTIARGLGGGIAIAVAEMLASMAAEAVADAAGAVVDFVASLW